MTITQALSRHIMWAIFVGLIATTLSFIVSAQYYIPLGCVAMAIIMFGSMMVNHVTDGPDPHIEEN